MTQCSKTVYRRLAANRIEWSVSPVDSSHSHRSNFVPIFLSLDLLGFSVHSLITKTVT